MDKSPFPPFDFSRFVWHPSAEDGVLEREAAGGEAFLHMLGLNHGEQNLFFGVETTISIHLDSQQLIEHARRAWIALRFDTPTIAASTKLNDAGFPLITYRTASDRAEVDAWADRTVILEETASNLDELRYLIGQRSIPDENGDQTFLYVRRQSTTAVGFLLYTSHVPFDGAGTKTLFSRFFKFFADSQLDISSFSWGAEKANLLPVAAEVLGKDEAREGVRYLHTLAAVLEDLGAAMPVRAALFYGSSGILISFTAYAGLPEKKHRTRSYASRKDRSAA